MWKMTIEKKGNKWCTISCHHDPGTVIACFDTKEAAEKQHRAIEVNKSTKKIEIDINKL
jgi:hypothetical protein